MTFIVPLTFRDKLVRPADKEETLALIVMIADSQHGGLKSVKHYAELFGRSRNWVRERLLRLPKGHEKDTKRTHEVEIKQVDTVIEGQKKDTKRTPKTRKSTPLELTDELRAEGLKLGLDNIEIEYQFERMTNWFLDKKKKRPVNRTAWTNWITSPYFAPMPDHVRQARKPKGAQRPVAVPEDKSQYVTPEQAKKMIAKIMGGS